MRRRFLFLGAAVMVVWVALDLTRLRDDGASFPPSATAASVASQTEGPAAPVGAAAPCEVARIVDGDTIECPTGTRIRLIGMDTPEMRQAPFGREARAALMDRIPVGTTVAIELDVEQRDRYDRVLGYVWSDGVLINWWLVRNGWAVLATYPPNVRYVDWFTRAQAEARAEARGLWARGGFDCPPADHRRGRC